MFNAANYVIDRVRRVTRVNLTSGAVDFTLTNIANPTLEFTGESTDKLDAYGVLLARFDGSKGVQFSGEASLLSAPLMAAQLGAPLEVAEAGRTIEGQIFDVVKVVTATSGDPAVTTITATLTYTPKTAPAKVYVLAEDKSIASELAIGSAQSEAAISGKVITFPADFTATSVGVLYKYDTEDAMKISDKADNYDVPAQYIVDILACDSCNPAIKRVCSVVFPKAKMDNNFSVNLSTEGTHPFALTALADYCSEGMELCYVLFNK